jgi:hypothetical protein
MRTTNVGWVPLAATIVTILAYLGAGALIFRGPPALRRARRKASLWRYYVRRWLTRKMWLREVEERWDGMDLHQSPNVPPPAEHVLWHVLWMVEVFLPTHAGALADSLRDLGWDKDGPLGRSDALQWLQEARVHGWPSSVSPGIFRSSLPLPPGTFAIAPEIDIPRIFRSVHPTFIQLGPGVTVLVAGFLLADEERSCLERTLRQPASARAVAKGWKGGHEVKPASMVRLERLGAERERIRAAAASWLSSNLCGVFAERATQPPSWDLITTEIDPPTALDLPNNDWRQALGIGFGAERWSLDPANEDIVLASPGFPDKSNSKPTFACLRTSLIERDIGSPKRLSGGMGLLGEQTAPVMAVWGLVEAVREYEAALAGPRDQPATNRAGRYIEHIRNGVLPAARDLAVVGTLTEYLGQEESLRWFAMSAVDLTWTPNRTNVPEPNPRPSLLPWLREQLRAQTTRTRRQADEVASAMQAYGDVLVARSNLRLQRIVVVLTTLILGLSGIGVWLALEAREGSGCHTARCSPSKGGP